MAGSTKIEWTQKTINFWVGCDYVSPGCKNCYATSVVKRYQHPTWAGLIDSGGNWTGALSLGSRHTWEMPARTATPSLMFVNSMSDFFHEAVPDLWTRRAVQTMQMTERHGYQVLTKRPKVMLERTVALDLAWGPWAWLGISVEDQRRLVERLPILIDTPGREIIRWISFEPLLGPIELDAVPAIAGIDWAVIGGESGPRARPPEAAWVRRLVQQLQDRGIPVFMKQWGTRAANPDSGDPTIGQSKGGCQIDGRLIRDWPKRWRARAAAEQLAARATPWQPGQRP